MTAMSFSIIGLFETVIYAVVGQGLHRPPAFVGVLGSAQGIGAIAGGFAMAAMARRLGSARMVGLALAGFTIGSAACLSGSVALVMAGMVADGAGLLWLVAVSGAAIQRYSPPRLQGRASAAWTMVVISPQTASIAAGAALISFVGYRVMLAAMIAVIGGCAVYLLVRPAAEPDDDPVPGAADTVPAAASH